MPKHNRPVQKSSSIQIVNPNSILRVRPGRKVQGSKGQSKK